MIELDAIEEVIIERTFASIEEVLVNVIIITIQSNEANDILGYLCKELSLHTFDLIHLKRIRKNIETNQLELIVCPESYALTDEILEKLGKYDQKIVPVPKYEPQNKKEFKSWAGYWPMNFHPSEDEREREKGFSEQEKQEIHQNLYKLLEDRENVLKFYQENNYHDVDKQSMAGGIMINPKGNKLIATTSQTFQFLQTQYSDTMKICNHPLFTSTMLCINLVGDIALEKYPGKGKFYVIFITFLLYFLELTINSSSFIF